MSELKVDKITPRLGTTLTLGDSGDTINFGSGVLPNFENLTVTGDLTVDTNSLKVDSTNNYVGIGTASPSVALDVVGTANIGSELNVAGTSALRVNTSRVSIDVSGSAATPSLVFNGDTNTGLFRVSSDTLGISTAGSERMRINSSGYIELESDNYILWGIGSTNRPAIRGDNINKELEFHNNGTEVMRITSSGNVGIGTTSPSSLLHVFSSAPKIIIQDGGTAGTNSAPRLEFQDGSSIQGIVDFADDGTMRVNQLKAYPLEFRTNNVERMRISSSGDVGVGESSIDSKFHVKDNLASTGVGTSSNPIVIIQNERLNTGTSSAVLRFDTNEVSGTQQHPRASIGAELGSQASNVDGRLLFGTADVSGNMTERMRIDSSGNVLVGTTDTSIYNNSGSGQGGASINIPSSGSGYVQVARDSGTALYLNRLVNDGPIIDVRQNGTQVGTIGADASSIYIAGVSRGLRFTGSQIKTTDATGNNQDNQYDLGSSTTRFKDFYLGGNIYLGGTGSANALDDYEEGTYNPFATATQPTDVTYSSARYTKIGRFVFCTIKIRDQRTTPSAINFDMPFADTAGADRVYGIEFGGSIRSSIPGTLTQARTSGGGGFAYGTYVIEAG